MSIKKLLVLSILVWLAIFLTQTGFAGTIEKAYVYVEIADAPPRIKNLEVVPELAYTDSEIFCEAEVRDENIDSLQLEYEWYLNGELVESKDKYLQASLQAGDEVACRITAIDTYQHASQAISLSIEIQPRGFLQATGYTVRNIREGDSDAKNNLATGSAKMLVGIIIILGFNLKGFKEF